jgi:L-ascorbate metabolism protein UlaG (beta-lactamase superfamily)
MRGHSDARRTAVGVGFALLVAVRSTPVLVQQGEAGLVKVTPLGSHGGELCRNDRALLFEDPTGLRILYDPGRTVDETDPRLGDVHVMLLSHAHSDHIGDVRPAGGGTCAAPVTGAANPNSNFASIAASKNAAVFAPGELADYLGRKIQGVRGTATPGCAAVGLDNEATVPQSAPCTAALRPGGSRTVRRAGASSVVRIAAVPAVHSNGIPAALVDTPGPPPGTTGYGGGEGGFIIQFTNGLVAYLTGDTGLFGDMETIIGRYYRPTLIVPNMSDTVTLGPDEAAFMIERLVRPATVMPSHVNEDATSGGALRAGTRVERFAAKVRSFTDVVLPLSGVVRSFDGAGRCQGCR